MSEGESTPKPRPPTIDLTATEIEPESADSRSAETAPPAEGGNSQAAKNPTGLRAHALGAAMGAVFVGLLAVLLWLSGFVPARNATPPTASNGTADIRAQLDKIQGELQSRPNDAALASRVANVEAQTKALSDSLAAINRRLDEIAVAAQSAGQHAEAANKAAEAAGKAAESADKAAQGAMRTANAAAKAAGDAASTASAAKDAADAAKSTAQMGARRSDLDALAGRMAALENAVKSLSASTAQKTASPNDRAARAAIAAAALRAAVEAGAPYQSELDAVKSLGADQNAIAALQPLAASGVPTAADLAHQLSQLLPSLQHAAGPAAKALNSGTLLGRLEDNAKTLVHITPIEAPAGGEPSAVVARLNADAGRGDLAAALADTAHLPQSAKSLVEPWVQKVNARAAALAASRSIAAKALAGLGSVGTQ